MRQIYTSRQHGIVPANGSFTLYDKAVKPGFILETKMVVVQVTDIAEQELGYYVISEQGVDLPVAQFSISTTYFGLGYSLLSVCLGHMDRVGVYLDALTAGQNVEFIVHGILWDFETWQHYGEVNDIRG